MSSATIADALREFMTINELLDDAYWESSSISHKDFIYDIISIFYHEISELNKLSIQDHHYPYEIITEGIRLLGPKLRELEKRADDIVVRTRTQVEMKDSISVIMAILKQQARNQADFK